MWADYSGLSRIRGFTDLVQADALVIWVATLSAFRRENSMPLLWILVIALIILAVAGGAAVSSFLWLVLIVALIVAVFAFMSGRRAV
jgi:fatty acid desaturase